MQSDRKKTYILTDWKSLHNCIIIICKSHFFLLYKDRLSSMLTAPWKCSVANFIWRSNWTKRGYEKLGTRTSNTRKIYWNVSVELEQPSYGNGSKLIALKKKIFLAGLWSHTNVNMASWRHAYVDANLFWPLYPLETDSFDLPQPESRPDFHLSHR